MRKLFYLILGGLMLSVGFASCDDEPDNPGDYNIRGSIGVNSVTSRTTGEEYELVVSREFDSTIVRYNLKYDTTFADDGSVVEINEDTVWYEDGTCHYVRMETVRVQPIAGDTLVISLTSNARWTSVVTGTPFPRWYNLITASGGGDSDILVELTEYVSPTATNTQTQFIITSDSAAIYEIPFLPANTAAN